MQALVCILLLMQSGSFVEVRICGCLHTMRALLLIYKFMSLLNLCDFSLDNREQGRLRFTSWELRDTLVWNGYVVNMNSYYFSSCK